MAIAFRWIFLGALLLAVALDELNGLRFGAGPGLWSKSLGTALALLSGAYLFWGGGNGRAVLRRALTQAYFVGALAGALGFLLLARGHGGAQGFLIYAIVWLGASGRALGYHLKAQTGAFKPWFTLSYALTLAVVSLKLQLALFNLAGISDNGILAWTCWLPQALWWLWKGRQA